ncbi:fibrous sheath CABYR-binding protein-like [Gouania willdenowi]|uniref:MICOS complex subunit n=1 Tax=Gouania willdenowi TaxID=441366 RepID=A0A8C5H8T7_GOUWI|nr:fibrous sheath CABYR-binding protein-like [Gouania willdenowi]
MAAKVAIVAVPAVLGIASIRVYTIRDTQSDELVTRQRLNIYTPLAESSQVNFVSESPGVIESGVTATREGILPIFRAVKGACVSIKSGTINLYHASEDVYYYLKDPPPGFLPRVGTISMAGLLGMFLARKGSRFKRLALPLGLTCAGASVCYPAQAVAVCKITGRNVYAAGQWSITSVSSLFTSTEPLAKEFVASQPQSVPVPNSESTGSHEASALSSTTETSPQSSATQEDDVESAKSVPIPSDPVVAKEEESTEIYDSAPTETNAENPLPAENGIVEEDTDIKPAVDHITISQPELVEASPVEAAAVEAAPVEAESEVPVEAAPVEAESAPAEAIPVEAEAAAPVEAAPVEASSVEASPVEVSPVEAAPVEAESAPVEAAPVESEAAPVEGTPVEAEAASPVEAAPVKASPVEVAPVEVAPVEVAPVEVAPVEVAPVEVAPVEVAPVEVAPVEVTPVEAAPVEVAPVESSTVPEEPSIPQTFVDLEASLITPKAAAEPEIMDQTPDSPTVAPSPAISKEGSGFKADPSIMDFGQSSPEDSDLYTTRS